MKTIVIVWPIDEKGAQKGRPNNCPVARAISEQTGLTAQVLGPVAILTAPEGHPGYPAGCHRAVHLPSRVRRYVDRFDRDQDTSGDLPLAFYLDTEDVASGWEIFRKEVRTGMGDLEGDE